jgi:hypothetical protein
MQRGGKSQLRVEVTEGKRLKRLLLVRAWEDGRSRALLPSRSRDLLFVEGITLGSERKKTRLFSILSVCLALSSLSVRRCPETSRIETGKRLHGVLLCPLVADPMAGKLIMVRPSSTLTIENFLSVDVEGGIQTAGSSPSREVRLSRAQAKRGPKFLRTILNIKFYYTISKYTISIFTYKIVYPMFHLGKTLHLSSYYFFVMPSNLLIWGAI